MNPLADLQPDVQRKLRAPRSNAVARVLAWSLLLSLGACGGACLAQSVAVPSSATNPVIYPAKDQSPRQQDKDKYECYDWARNQSGFDPAQAQQPQAAPVPAPQAAPTSTSAGTAGVSAAGMAKGAMGGAAIAELGDHDAGKGAAAGAVGMALIEKVKQRQAQIAKEQQMGQQQAMQMSQASQLRSQEQAARGQQRATYGKAFAACLEARGYVVK